MLDLVKEYASKRLDLMKLEAAEKSSITLGALTFLIIATIAAIFFIVLLNIGLAFLLGSYLGNYAYGLLIMAGFYLIIFIVVLSSRNTIKNSIANQIIKFFND